MSATDHPRTSDSVRAWHDRIKCLRCRCIARRGPHAPHPACCGSPPSSAPWIRARIAQVAQERYAQDDACPSCGHRPDQECADTCCQ